MNNFNVERGMTHPENVSFVAANRINAHRAKRETPEAKAILKTRGQIVERSFADLKEHRKRRCHTGRGLNRATINTGLAVLVHNLVSLHTLLKRPVELRTASP